MSIKEHLLNGFNKNSNSINAPISKLTISRAQNNHESIIDNANNDYLDIDSIKNKSDCANTNKLHTNTLHMSTINKLMKKNNGKDINNLGILTLHHDKTHSLIDSLIDSKVQNIKDKLFDTTKSFSQYLGFAKETFTSNSASKIKAKDITDKSIYLCKVKGADSKKTVTSTSPICIEAKFINDEYLNDQENNNKYVELSINVKNAIIRTVTLPTMKDKELITALRSKKLWNGYDCYDRITREYSIIYQVIKRTKSCKTMDVLLTATKLSDTNIHSNNRGSYQVVDTRCNIVNNLPENRLQKKWPNVYLNLSYHDNYAMIIDDDTCHVFDINISEIEKNIILNNSTDDSSINFLCENYAKQINSIIFDYEYKNKLRGINNIFIVSSPISSNHIINKLRNMLLGYNISEYNFLDNVTAKDELSANFNKAFNKIRSLPALFNNSQGLNKVYSKGTKKIINRFILSTAISSIAAITLMVSTFLDLRLEEKKLSKQISSLETIEPTHNRTKTEHDKLDNLINIASNANNNQQKLLSIYHYLNLVTLEDVWLKEINFVAPNSLEISGGSYSDGSILEFIDLLNEGNQFKNVSLRNMNSVREVSMQNSEVYNIKAFKIDSIISDSAAADSVVYKENNEQLANADDIKR